MRIVLESQEAYAEFEKLAKAKGQTTRELGKQVISEYLTKAKK